MTNFLKTIPVKVCLPAAIYKHYLQKSKRTGIKVQQLIIADLSENLPKEPLSSSN